MYSNDIIYVDRQRQRETGREMIIHVYRLQPNKDLVARENLCAKGSDSQVLGQELRTVTKPPDGFGRGKEVGEGVG